MQRRLLLWALVFAAFALTLALVSWREGLWQPAAASVAKVAPQPLPGTPPAAAAAAIPMTEAAPPVAAADPPAAQSEPGAAPDADPVEARRERAGRGSRTR